MAAAIFVVVALALLPLAAMLARSFFVNGSISLDNYTETLGRARVWGLLLNSLALAGNTTLVAGTVGVGLAIGAVKSAIPFRSAIVSIFCLPLLFPPYVLANGWFQILGRQGLVSRWFGDPIAVVTSGLLFGLPGGVLVLSTALLPVVMLLSIASLSSVNPSLEDAARLSCGWSRVLKSVTLPLAQPGILLSLVLTFLLALGELSAPSFLRLDVFPIESFTQFTAFYNAGAATAAAFPFAAGALLLLLGVRKWTGAGDYHFRWTHSQSSSMSLGGFEPWIAAAVLTVAATTVILPCAALVHRGLSITAITTAWDRAADSMAWSLLYGALAATAITVFGFFLGYASQRRSIRGAGLISLLTLMLFALPGTLIGIGLVTGWNRPSLVWLYAGPATLIAGLVMQYAAIGERGIASTMAQVAPSLEEAAEIAGASWFRRVWVILVPLLRPSLLAVWLLAFVLCLRDTSLSLLLSPPGRDPLTARTMTLMANGSQELISALCLFSIVLPSIPVMLGVYASRSGRRL
ncbi:MAG: iron ABC transporter permease [Acidobacteria bacterium]|nr:iron ABC transporter permease [Acidobacteriota bacterium]